MSNFIFRMDSLHVESNNLSCFSLLFLLILRSGKARNYIFDYYLSLMKFEFDTKIFVRLVVYRKLTILKKTC